MLSNANSLEEQTATPPEVTAFLNILQERPYSIENVFEQSSSTDSTDVETSNLLLNLSTDSTDGETSNPVSNLTDYLRKYNNWSDWRFNVYIKTMVTFKPENEEKEGKEKDGKDGKIQTKHKKRNKTEKDGKRRTKTERGRQRTTKADKGRQGLTKRRTKTDKD